MLNFLQKKDLYVNRPDSVIFSTEMYFTDQNLLERGHPMELKF